MALTDTDKKEIERIARREIKDFIDKPAFVKEISTIIEKELKSNGKNRQEIVDLTSQVILELYKTFWFRKSLWYNELKRVK
jgi:hypothetical protein